MSKKILFFFFLWSSFLLQAQYTNVINSNRPGFSESPYSVGLNVYQLEAGLFYNTSKIVRTFTRPISFGSAITFRTSFFSERLELNSNFTFQKDKVAFKNVFTSHYFTTGISDFSFGAKYLVYEQAYEDKSKEVRSWRRRHAFDWKRTIPSVAVYAGLNTNLVNDIYKLEKATPKVGVLLQNNFTNQFNLISNIYYNYIGSAYAELSYIITGTYVLNYRWSTFLEHQGSYNKYQIHNNFGAGLAFLANRHLQIDASTRVNWNGKTAEHYTAIGFSFRIDRHVDGYRIINDFENQKNLNNTKSK
ncbi:MAG: transporter [Flavobacteriaceae bacterium]|nr:transporter [Flavobacteriaceae bacterium]